MIKWHVDFVDNANKADKRTCSYSIISFTILFFT